VRKQRLDKKETTFFIDVRFDHTAIRYSYGAYAPYGLQAPAYGAYFRAYSVWFCLGIIRFSKTLAIAQLLCTQTNAAVYIWLGVKLITQHKIEDKQQQFDPLVLGTPDNSHGLR
jgi:hypothetical protein